MKIGQAENFCKDLIAWREQKIISCCCRRNCLHKKENTWKPFSCLRRMAAAKFCQINGRPGSVSPAALLPSTLSKSLLSLQKKNTWKRFSWLKRMAAKFCQIDVKECWSIAKNYGKTVQLTLEEWRRNIWSLFLFWNGVELEEWRQKFGVWFCSEMSLLYKKWWLSLHLWGKKIRQIVEFLELVRKRSLKIIHTITLRLPAEKFVYVKYQF